LARLGIVLAALAAGYVYFRQDQSIWLLLSITLFALFAWVFKRHLKLRKKLALERKRVEVNEEEVQAFDNDFSAFESGSTFIDPSHSFSSDLDLFGPRSLFQRLNRTTTQRGLNALAQAFRINDMEQTADKQAAIKELGELSEWREFFRAHGKSFEEDAELDAKLKRWAGIAPSKSAVLKPYVLWPLTVLFSLIAVVVAVFVGLAELDKLLWLAVFNLGVFGLFSKMILKERSMVNDLSKSIDGYTAMIEMVETTSFESEVLRSLQQRFSSEGVAAGEKLKKLNSILDRLDSMDNLVVLIFLNGTILYHLHALVALYAWKRQYAGEIAGWIDTLGEVDRLVSLATFAFNHPDFEYPQVNQGAVFKAENIGHPFLNAQDRVSNSIAFDGFRLVILTGSNMAGKSTFLRTLGVNVLLAGLGAPVCAESFQCSPVQLLTSMKPQDSLDGNESYFQAEVKRLRSLMDQLESAPLSFVLLDEILRGTNSKDKRNGTRAFLEKIKDFNLLGVIATHDVEIAEMTAEDPKTFRNLFFESTLKEGELHFDYQLREGVCNTPNATDLMRAKGII